MTFGCSALELTKKKQVTKQS